MKILICGAWHVHASDYYREAVKYAEIVGCYEPDDGLREEYCKARGLKGYSDLNEALKSGATAAIVCTSTDTHTETMIKLAEAGIDIFTEKVLAMTVAECEKIKAAIEKSGVRFVVSLPQKYWPQARAVKQVIDSGELGKVNLLRFRNAHGGSSAGWLPKHFYNQKQCGGGAMIDLGAHGMYLIDWLLGMPKAAQSTFTVACESEPAKTLNSERVEDNAVTVMSYENGCIAINETGFVSSMFPTTLEVFGEKGYVRYSGEKLEKCTSQTKTPVEIEFPEALPLPIVQFCTDNILPGCGIGEAIRLTRLMEMAYGN